MMYAPLKAKGSRKNRDKARTIECAIPAAPRISDFQETQCLEPPSNQKDDTVQKEHNVEDKHKEEENEKVQVQLLSDELSDNGKEEKELNTEISKGATSPEISEGSIYESKNDVENHSDTFTLKNIEVSGVNNYFNLALKVKNYITEVNEPSAPAVEGNFSAMNSPVMNAPEKEQSTLEQLVHVGKYNFTLQIEDALAPFTDEKLNEYYYNPELLDSKNYVDEFINQEINNGTKGDSDLYRLLVNYIQAKNNLKATESQITSLRNKLNICISAMWTVWDDVTVTEEEKCSDGNSVTFTEKYTQVQFNPQVLQEFNSLFSQLKHEVFEVHSMNSFACSSLKFKIEYYLQCLLTSCPEFTNLEEDSPAVLSLSSTNSHFQQCLINLKAAISILFIFQRKQSLEVDSSFLEETRQWLTDLVAIILRNATWKDHIFLLNHIMRCPGGGSEWAAEFIQLPFSKISSDPFQNVELNHMMTVMSILLSPVEEREKFIKKWESELASDANPWTVIDSDGEVEDDENQWCPLKENDLVAFLNQIPFGDLFEAVLKCGDDRGDCISSEYLMKLFSFLTEFVKVLLTGLKQYSTQRYRQFTKRLGRLICHVVQYATDSLVIFKSQRVSEDELQRIQTEYDSFFLRSTKFIYSAKKHGAWQFLATIPFHMASSNTILKLYGILQLNDHQDESVIKVDFSNFVDKFLQLPQEEQFYLLTTLANMALARNPAEIQFIKNILLQLLFIGFLNPSTMEDCYKNVRSLVCSICSSYPFLMSEVLCIQQTTFTSDSTVDQRLTLDLWAKLPVEIWQPDKKDLRILALWLLDPVDSVRNELARLILQSLNYGLRQGELFLSVENHHAIACMILQANAKLSAGNESGVIKNVSNLVLYQAPDQSINDWTWNVLLKLRLHLLDKSDAEMCKYFSDLNPHLRNIPDIKSNFDLHHLILKKHPVACYIALMTTTLGHSVPIIFDKGFELVEVLLNDGKYEPGLACLEYLTLLFVDCSDSIYKCETFMTLLSRLIAADNSYVQFAKNLISYNFPGPVLKCVESMIQNQLNRWRALNLTKFSNIIQLWLHSFTRLPLWTQEPGVVYLIDKLVNNSFFDGVTMKTVSSILGDLLEAQSPSSETKSSFSSLVGWMNSKYNPPSLLPKGFNGDVPWFAYLVIQMEYETYEKSTFIWVELLKELYSSNDKKVNVDNCLKKVCNSLKIPVRSSSSLAIYKWTYQILETEISHPLAPLMWQRFFSLYFYRVPGLINRGSIGVKFFDGLINQGLFKRLKAKLEETSEYYRTLTEKESDRSDFNYLKCHSLFQTYSVWLYDPKLHDPCISIRMLSIQYNPELLDLLIHGSEISWTEYLDYQNIEQGFRNTGLTWTKLKNRLENKKGNRIISRKVEKLPLERIKERLNTYEVPLPPPRANLKKYTFPQINLNTMMNADKMMLFIKPLLQALLDYKESYANEINENVALSCDMQELLPRLYITTKTQKVLKKHCGGGYRVVNGKSINFSCSGPAVVKLTFEESRLNDPVKRHFDACEKALDQNIKKSLSMLPTKLILSAVLIDVSVRELKKEYELISSREGEDSKVRELNRTGVHLFYELAQIWSKRVTHTPPLNRAFENYVDVLGKGFVENNPNENEKLLHLILTDEQYGAILCNYFSPNSSSTSDFIYNYSTALECTPERSFFILSKFDLIRWLSEKKPKFSERSRLISAMGKGLKAIKGDGEGKSLLKLLNQHLEILFMYDFPEHYGEVLNFLLEASEKQLISPSTWFMFLNALAFGQFAFVEGRSDQNVFEPGQSVKKLKCYFSKFATDQNLLSFEVVRGTIIVLAGTFKSERIKVGAHGLYRKYRLYLESIFTFFGMLCYSCVTKVIEISTGSLSDKLAQQLWPLINDLYSPWLVPYWTESHKGQELHLPWTLNDSCHASFCASIFTESVRFVFDALPGLNHVLSYTWFFYVSNFANIYVKDFVLNVIHDNLVSLPWKSFFPSLQDVEMMLKVVDQFLPLCHSFLGNIFVSIKWTELVQYYLSEFDTETTTRLHICLLHLLVKLPLEPSLKQNENIIALLTEANTYAWHLVDSTSYETVFNWFIMSCDPRIILMDERLEYYKLDSTILRLLQACAGFVTHAKVFHPNGLAKKLIYIRAHVKWMVTSNRRFKSKDSPLFKTALQRLWSDIEAVITETVPRQQRIEEAPSLLSEFLLILAESELCSLVETTLCDWLLNRKTEVILFGLLRSAGSSIENPHLYGSIIESSLENYFTFLENCDWSEIIDNLTLHSKTNSEARLDNILRENNHLLTLYATLIKRYKKNGDFCSKIILTDLLQLLSEVKSSVDLEPKLILLITFGLRLTGNEIKSSEKEGLSYLVKFTDIFTTIANDKGTGFLSAIGLKKSNFSNKFKLICLVASSGIIIFLKNSYPDYRGTIDEKILISLEQAEANKGFQNIYQYVSYAKDSIKNVSDVEEIIGLLKHLGLKLFNKLYLK